MCAGRRNGLHRFPQRFGNLLFGQAFFFPQKKKATSYDFENRLTEVSTWDDNLEQMKQVAQYSYDANNLRIQKKDTNNTQTNYIYDINGNLLEEKTVSEDEIQYVLVNGRHIARVKDSETLYYGLNNVGSTVFMADEDGDVVWSGDITPYGDDQVSSGVVDDTVAFAGKQMDEDTGLYYFNQRWYNPGMGRFITKDPIRDGQNWYIYVQNNPLGFVDPMGLELRNANDEIHQQDTTTILGEGKSTIHDEGCTLTSYVRIASDITGEKISLDEANKTAIENKLYTGKNKNELSPENGAKLMSILSGEKIEYKGEITSTDEKMNKKLEELQASSNIYYATGRIHSGSVDGKYKYDHHININKPTVWNKLMSDLGLDISDTSTRGRTDTSKADDLFSIDVFQLERIEGAKYDGQDKVRGM